MGAKQMVAVAKLERPMVTIDTYPTGPTITEIGMPPGCLGIMFVFESKRAAYAWHGKKVKTIQIEFDNKDKLK